jgi:parallel beta-helix repeat protein
MTIWSIIGCRGAAAVRRALPILLLSLAALSARAEGKSQVTLLPGATGDDIQKALDQLPASGGEVILPPGKYDVRKPIILRRDNQTLRGSGASTVLRLAAKSDCPVIIMGAPTEAPPRVVSRLRVSDLLIDGNRSEQTAERWAGAPRVYITNNGMLVDHVEDSEVDGVTCCHCRSGGLVTADATRRLVVRDFGAFDSYFDGLACYQTEDSIFSNLLLCSNLAAGISLDLSFNNNLVSDAILTDNEQGIFMRDTRDNVFQGLVIRRCRKHGVFLGQHGLEKPDGWVAIPGTKCSDNSFVGVVISDNSGAGFYPTEDCCARNQIYGAQMHDNVAGNIGRGMTNEFIITGLMEK